MTVGIQRLLNIRVSEVAGDGDDGDTGGDEHRGAGVPEIVQTDLLHAALFAPFGKAAVKRAVCEGVIAAEDKQVIGALIEAFTPRAKIGGEGLRDRDISDACVVLRGGDGIRCVFGLAGDRFCDADLRRIEINIRPGQCQRLALAATGGVEQAEVKGIERLIHGGDKSLKFLRRPKLHFLFRFEVTETFHAGHDIFDVVVSLAEFIDGRQLRTQAGLVFVAVGFKRLLPGEDIARGDLIDNAPGKVRRDVLVDLRLDAVDRRRLDARSLVREVIGQ